MVVPSSSTILVELVLEVLCVTSMEIGYLDWVDTFYHTLKEENKCTWLVKTNATSDVFKKEDMTYLSAVV